MSSLLQSAAVGLAVVSLVSVAGAHPYASGITNSAGTIKFILNENADSVKVAFDNGSVTNDLGALAQGVQSFALGSHTNYLIIVSKVGTGVPSQLSVDTNNFVKFNSPRGVSVNTNPKTRNFGRIYVANSAAGSAGGRSAGDGLYVLNADQTDCLGKGDTASTAGVNFGTGGASDPWKVGLGPDDLLYVNNFSTAAATTWLFDPDLGMTGLTTTNLVFEGIGENVNTLVHTDSAGTPVVRGSLATGNLTIYQVDGAMPPWNSFVRYDIGSGPLPWNSPPVILGNAGIPSVADLNTDVDLGPDGKFYTSINRSAGTDVPSIQVFATDGTTLLWDSMTAGGTPDPLRQARAVMVSPDGKYLASVHDDNHVSILPLTNGVPDLANLSTIDIGPTTTFGRDMAWDAADNIYTVSSGQALLRVYSLGFTTTAITGNDSTGTNGTFQLITPSATVSVAATQPDATEAGPVAGVFTITRAGSDVSSPLTVNFALSGTATNGVNYTTIATNSVVIKAGTTSTNITITPIKDNVSDPTLTVILQLKGGSSYSAVAPSKATVTIADNGPQVLVASSTAASSMYEAITNDYVTFTVTRWGDTNAASFSMGNFTYGGTAVPNVDFVPFSGTLTFDPGVSSQTFNISPLHNTNYTGNKTLTVTVAPGTGYTAATNTASATIIDAENAPETVLFSDSLKTDTSANWTVRFMANNLIDDYRAQFGYDMGIDNIANAPNGSFTALKLNVNKDDATANGSAGINLYPTGKSFSGNFSLRFSMNLVQNDGAGTTEFFIFGINHSGTKTNWFLMSGDTVNNTPTDSDGLWFAVVADASGSSPADYVLYTGNGATNGPLALRTAFASSFANAFKEPPYSADGGAGSPASKTGNTNSIWSDVEVRKIGNVVRMSINKTVIFNYTNTTAYTNGNIMIGYCDPYASIGAADGGVYLSNLRVVSLAGPTITSAAKSGSNLNITFADESNDPVSAFRLVGSSVVTGTYANMSATISQTGPGKYSTSTPIISTNSAKLFRIQHLP